MTQSEQHQLRATALNAALATSGGSSQATVLAAAETFYQFLIGALIVPINQ